ncbi:GPI-anchored surface protein, putative [Bodo saltans]|uniref:GPI-anchored surface protein, putative n=1 Tax=Bodo saltans TaxID=75058 RepID=A0A0S4KPP2_BODSA|nr:GPI-anchored surface protein, putative [Bodo saltans]|eukprot:CUI14887.1 GPI-anchored surface protein, putative [Bodo saltans]
MSDWNSTVVVRANNNNNTSVASPRGGEENTLMLSTTRGTGSSASLRSTAVIVTTTATSPRDGEHGGSDVARGVIQPYTSCQRALITTTPTNAPALPFYSSLIDADAASDRARTFWKPDTGRGEIGLLETLHRRADNTMMHLLVSSRPTSELRHNFSARNGDCICLEDDLFKLSKTHFALRHMEKVDDHVTVDGHQIKSVLREQLPQLHQDDYYLVAYRDYSAWAVGHYSSLAKRDSTLGPKYVEQYFAIRVGQNAGSFLPITEAQFLFGCEILEHQRHSATAAQIASRAVNLFALNTDQYRSMSAVGVSANHGANANNSAGGATGTAAAASSYVAPSPWDWTPTAVEKRVNHFLDQQYRAVGRLVVKGLLVGFCTYLFVQYVRRGTGLTSASTHHHHHDTSSRGSRRRMAAQQQQRYDDMGSGSVVGGVLRSVFVTGPKEVFDFILGS